MDPLNDKSLENIHFLSAGKNYGIFDIGKVFSFFILLCFFCTDLYSQNNFMYTSKDYLLLHYIIDIIFL